MHYPRSHRYSRTRFVPLATALTLLVASPASALGPDPEPAPLATPVARALPTPVELVTAKPTPLTSATESRPLGPAVAGSAPATVPANSAVPGLSRTTLSLAAVLGLIVVAALLVKRLPRGGAIGAALNAAGRAPSGVVEVLGRFTLSRGVTLILIKVDRRIVLVSQTGQRAGATIAALLDIDHPEDVASIIAKCRGDTGDTLDARFESALSRADRATASAQRPRAAQRPPAPTAQDHNAAQLSQALRARLAAMRSTAPSPRKAAA